MCLQDMVVAVIVKYSIIFVVIKAEMSLIL